MLVIQGVCGVLAWCQGWKGWPLAPVLVAVAFLKGLAWVDAPARDVLAGPALLVQIACLVVQVAMAVCGRERLPTTVAVGGRRPMPAAETVRE